MGFQTLIIGIAFLLFGIIFIVPVLTNIENIAEDGLLCGALGICLPEQTPTEETERFKDEVKKQETEAEKRFPQSELMCDIEVRVKADLVQFGGIGSPYVEIDNADPSDYTWYCKFPKQWGTLNNLLHDFSLLDFFAFEDEFIRSQIKLVQKNNPDKWIDGENDDYKTMVRDIRLVQTNGLLKTPYNLDQSFYIENVPYLDYNLEIYYGRTINNLNAGEPVIDKVCTVGNNC